MLQEFDIVMGRRWDMMLREDYLVEQSYELNSMISVGWTLQEVRLLTVYLAKINARDRKTRKVTFTVKEYESLLGVELDRQYLLDVTRHLRKRDIETVYEDGSFEGYNLFSMTKYDRQHDRITISCTPETEELFFDLSRHYFKYELWNALNLGSTKQVRLYQLLKQREKLGEWEVPVEVLYLLLGVEGEGERRWDNFRKRTLDAGREALEASTDIKFDYEHGKRGRGGKWKTIKFKISHNEPAQLTVWMYQFSKMKLDGISTELRQTEPKKPKITAEQESVLSMKDKLARLKNLAEDEE